MGECNLASRNDAQTNILSWMHWDIDENKLHGILTSILNGKSWPQAHKGITNADWCAPE